MAMVKVCLALLVLCICSSLAQSPWQAFFTDARHGGRIASCVEGSLIWGVYSNGVGYFQGNISSDGTVASGKWYEAGHVDGATGSFSWTLTTGQNGFSGIRQTQYYRCAPSIWSETKITAAGIPTREDCKRLYDNTQIFLDIRGIEGSYTSGVSSSLHICVSPTGHYELSYFIGSTQSYSTGYVRAGSVLGTGSFVDSTSNNFGLSNTGIEMLLLTDPDATNLGLRSNNGTRLVQYRFRGVSDATDVDVSVDQVSVREWTRSTVFQQSCDLFRQLYTQPWVGAWTDKDFGFGRLYVCQTVGGTVRGVYSELGWIEGSVSNDGLSVNGRFYDAGDSNQVSGDFTWTLVDRTHFTGHWSFDNSAKRYWWNETRVSVGKPSSVLCMLPDSSVASPSNPLGSTIAGVWRYDASPTADTLDICFNADNTRFEASYNFNGGVDRGYITGFVRDFGSALQGEWHETGLQGILTMQLTAPNVFYMLRWTHGDIQASYYYVCDDESGDILWVRHRNVAFTQRTSTTAKASSCARNADLINFAQAGPFVPTGFTDKYAVSYVAFKEPKKRNIFEFFMGLISNDSAQDDDTSSASVLSASAPLLVALAAIVICCIC